MARLKLVRRLGALLVVGGLVGGAWLVQFTRSGIEPMPESKTPKYERFDKSTPFVDALTKLQQDGIVKNASAMRFYGLWRRQAGTVAAGTYDLHPGMNADQILTNLHSPIRKMVRIPETNWSKRTGRWLEKNEVCAAADYQSLVKKPKDFAKEVSFPLPSDTLEGYLWPDTYDLPPLTKPKEIIIKQLKAFEKKVWIPLKKPADLRRILIIASMIELEVAKDDERPIVAGVIENRLKKGMPLQLDATILFAQDNWHEPTLRDLRKTESPFNTYKHKGLPPTPVCSPSLKSIEAAMHPTASTYLYYVALPNGHSLFASTVKQHEANILVRKAALAIIRGGHAVVP